MVMQCDRQEDALVYVRMRAARRKVGIDKHATYVSRVTCMFNAYTRWAR